MGHLALDIAGPVSALVVDIDKDDGNNMQDTGISEANEDHGEPVLEVWNEDKEDSDEESKSGASDDEACETNDNENEE